MNGRILTLVLGLFLQGCSTLCLVGENPIDSDIVIIDMEHSFASGEERVLLHRRILEECDFISSYSNDVGIFPDSSRFFLANSKPSCLLKKSKNDAVTHNVNVIAHGSTWHFETGSSDYSSVYICESEVTEKVKAYNKYKNEQASKADPDAAKTRRPF